MRHRATDTVAVWGSGPVGQMAIRSAILLGAKQVVAIDRLPERLSMAEAAGAILINFEQESTVERLNELTGGKGPEKCIDAVGLEAHATATIDAMYDRAKQAMMMETDRPHVLREMIYVCRPAGTLSVPGVYGGLLDKMQSTSIVRCDQPQRFLGVSLANCNVVISLVLAGAAVWGIRTQRH